MATTKKRTFAGSVQRLEEIIETMERSDTSLEEALKLYREGMALAMHCGEVLHSAEQEVNMLKQSADDFFCEVRFNWEE